ncbi:MAG: ABC transporter substrate-binding protein [Methylovulum sp.]|jgi:NitT/TauT family transport system substrate-binding protein|nr:ABC transporter substrate-binding protein [Methylovulum sp.]MCF7997506.1 ABC transporter substrate-binding protein [Methylovulum sp.]MCF8006662.1 ABC transporter substrate-binding protein [Methylovulum sp.]
MKILQLIKILLLLLPVSAIALEPVPLRIGAQAAGTLEWELSIMALEPTDDFKLQVQDIATPEAGKIALQSGAVDMIVADWIWVSKLRASGSDLTFYPYSNASGALLVRNDSPINTIMDLHGKHLGIAGGELDKNWLLLQALAQQSQFDINASVEKTFAAPPLLNEQLKQGRIDAVLTYWNFAAKLEPEGFKQLIDGKDIIRALGVVETVPSLGYVFKQGFANDHKKAVNRFFEASQKAKNLLCTSDPAWQKVIPLTKTDNLIVQQKLRQRYCEGIVRHWGEAERQSAEQIYKLLRSSSNNQLTGSVDHIQAGTFWTME